MSPLILLCALWGYAAASGWTGYHGEPYYAPKFAPAPLAHDGRVVDTPEVAHAKAEHLAAHAAAAHKAPWSPAPAPAHGPAWAPGPAVPLAWAEPGLGAHHGYGKWTGPPAHIELTHDGKFLKDTPEVAHAKAAHAAAFSEAARSAAASPDYGHGYAPYKW